MKIYNSINTLLIIFTIGIITFFGVLSFTNIQAEFKETNKIEAYFSKFENLNQYQKQDSISPKIVTYSQLKNFNENDNYLHNKKDISNRVTTYSKSKITSTTPKKHDISNRITTYSKSKITSTTSKKYDVSNRITTYSSLKEKNKNKQKTKTVLKTKKTESESKNTLVKNQKSKVKKNNRPKKNIITSPKKRVVAQKQKTHIKLQPKKNKKTIKKPIVQKIKTLNKTLAVQIKSNQTETLHYNKKELNTATNINLIESAPVYPKCQNKITENDKKACLLTNISQFVLDNFNSAIGKKAGLKKGFYEIRILFIIDENGKSKTYKVLGKYNYLIKNEVKKIINKLPTMIPGKSNGKNVPVKYSIKVLFEVK